MKFEDIFPAVRAGKRPRKRSWQPDHPGLQPGDWLSMEALLDDDWEVIQPTVTITEEQLKNALKQWFMADYSGPLFRILNK